MHSPMGWVSYPYRAATTDYLCCGQALEDSSGAGRIGLTRTFSKSPAKVRKKKQQHKQYALFFSHAYGKVYKVTSNTGKT